MIIKKFGGSSVANRAQIEKVLAIAKADVSRRPVVVTSAHKGVTNALVSAARAAVAGELDPGPVIGTQRGIAESLGCPEDLLDPLFSELRDLLRGLALVKELSPRSLDYISSFGERMSARCLADFFTRNGLRARAHDVWDLGFVTDANFGRARPVDGWEVEARRAIEALDPNEVPIITGFIGKTRGGEITTVGRNGSDLTASLLAAAVQAEEVQIWSDTDGVLSGDPSVVPGARNIPHMRFDEAAELAYFGSRVLHPSTLLPAVEANIPVRVLNTNRPEHPGTVISSQPPAPTEERATSIAYKEGQCVLTISSTRMFGRSGFLADVFGVLARHHVVVDMISTSEITVSLTSHDEHALRAALPELAELGDCEIGKDRTILVVVGRQLPTSPGLGSGVLGAMSAAGVNVEMISHSRGSINFSLLIRDEDIDAAVPVLHKMLFETST
jgi:aspartate kinase